MVRSPIAAAQPTKMPGEACFTVELKLGFPALFRFSSLKSHSKNYPTPAGFAAR
jgi:hypothetical protein